MFLPTPLYDIVNIALHISLKNFEQQCDGINIHFAALHGYSIEAVTDLPVLSELYLRSFSAGHSPVDEHIRRLCQ